MTPPPQPTINTERLTLRSYAPSDAARVAELAGDREVAATTLRIPHPYDASMAAEWIAGLPAEYAAERAITWAITLTGAELIGSIALSLHLDHHRAELGYWVGKPYWGKGYVTEAARSVMDHGFGALHLHRISAHHMSVNPASGTVMKKLGMRHEGILRHHTRKNGEYHDVECYGVLAAEYAGRGPHP